MRPLPQLVPASSWFWSSGGDGHLRVQACVDCSTLVHGFGFLYEAILQLRHEAGERQVNEARTAIVTSGGGTPSGVLLLRSDT